MVLLERQLFYVQLEESAPNSVAVFHMPADANLRDLKQALKRSAPFMVRRPDGSYSAGTLAATCKLRDMAEDPATHGAGRCHTRPFVFLGRDLLELLQPIEC